LPDPVECRRMRLVRSLFPPPKDLPEAAVAVGNFDGLHRGHQALLARVCSAGGGLAPAMMYFEPLPKTFFQPDKPVPRLLTLRDRLELCREFGLEMVFRLRFNQAFASQSPEAFARDVLAGGARAREVVVGSDFRFGARAAGDVAALREFGQQMGFRVRVVDPVMDAGRRISSSGLRQALGDGDLATAEGLLGRRYRISGRVIRGRRLGRELGFPTVNLRVPEPPALRGVFAVRVSGAGLDGHPAVASLGQRPTVAGKDWLLEVHLFDFNDDLYGRHLGVDFVARLRPEVRFDSLEAMTEQMKLDAEQARGLLD